MSISYVGLRFRKTLSGGTPAIAHMPLVATAYYDGNVLRVNGTTGSACLCASGGTIAAGFVMIGNVTNANSSSGVHPMYIINGDSVFEARMRATGARRARTGDLACLNVGTTYNYRLGGTAGAFRILEPHPDDAGGTAANGRYYVTGGRSQFAPYGRLSTN